MLKGYRADMTTCPIDPEVSCQPRAISTPIVLPTPVAASDE